MIPEIDDFVMEVKEDSAAKLAEASGKPTKYYLFAEEFNSIKTYLNLLKFYIVSIYTILEDYTLPNIDQVLLSGSTATDKSIILETSDLLGSRVSLTPNYIEVLAKDGYKALSMNSSSVIYDNGQTGYYVLEFANAGNPLPPAETRVLRAPFLDADETIATQEYVGVAINQLINGAPSDANTLKELNDKILAINAIIGGTTADGDSIVNTVAEVLHVLENYPEGSNIALMFASKIDSANIVNNLTQVVAGKVLDASQGKALKDLIESLTASVNTALAGKVDKVTGKGLSTEDYTTTEKQN